MARKTKVDPLLEALSQPPRRGPGCKVCNWLKTAPHQRADAVGNALSDTMVPINTIRRALVAGGVTHIANYALTRHREEQHGRP